MIVVITAFVMIVALGIAAIMKLESESRSEQFSRLSKRRATRFID